MKNGRCRMHGGVNPGGPLTAGGRHSKYLPQRLAGRYQDALEDTELLSTNAEIALIDTRLSELFGRLDTSETSLAWKLANKLYREMQGSDPVKAVQARHQLGDVLEKGLHDSQAWDEIAGMVEQRRKCTETEVKRLTAREQFVTAKQANVLMARIIQLVTENVPDPDARRRIASGLAQLSHSGDQRRDQPGGRSN